MKRLSIKRIFAISTTAFFLSCTYRSTTSGISTIYDAQSFEKSGRASIEVLFGIFVFGDNSVNSAMENGGIHHIHHIDQEVSDYLIYRKVTTLVYGEEKRPTLHEQQRMERIQSEIASLNRGDEVNITLKTGEVLNAIIERIGSNIISISYTSGKKQVLKVDDVDTIRKIGE